MIHYLSQTVSDNPAQVKLLKEVSETIEQWHVKVTEPVIQLRTEIGDAHTMNDMAQLIGEARGKAYFDKFRGQLALFIERENTLMTTRQAQAKTSSDIEELRQLTQWVEHTYNVIAKAQAILRCRGRYGNRHERLLTCW